MFHCHCEEGEARRGNPLVILNEVKDLGILRYAQNDKKDGLLRCARNDG